MRRLLLLMIATLLVHGQMMAQGYQLTVKLKNYKDGKLFLGHYMGKSTFLADSADISPAGVAVLKGKTPLNAGIYLLVMPDKQRYIETLIDKHQVFEVGIDTSDFVNKTTYKNSADNDFFLAYNKFLAAQDADGKEIQAKLKAARTADDTAKVQPLQTALMTKIQDYRLKFIKEHPDNILSTIFNAMREPEVPTKPANEDSLFAYRYFKTHYWDNVDLTSDRLVRTPVLEAKLQKYFTQLVIGMPDSINVEADVMIDRTRKNKEVFKFVLWWLTYNYESSPYMGMDAVFVHLVEKYYVGGEAYWLNDEQKNKIINRAYALAPNLIGQQAAQLELKDTASQAISLYKTQAKYTILVFWDPTCGHCKIEVPRLDSAYNAKWKAQGVKMIGIKTEGSREEWISFIKDHHLKGWIHASDPQSTSNYRRLYDVYSTPVVYLLDEKKKIVAKRLGVEQLDQVLSRREDKGDKATASK
ncbi:TlpA family protein disulfide reductase [Chitinophaga sp. Cy-1792]|uniref:TlpA family protein disulfide reductase n=1 Tax=Chitinophaga sp. Cy-1792 TaxID=2608339 RepID=UPI0014210BAB|nr:TlpA family protein disulfide reductase [Chitinophaga sp. Cy-1792]